LAKDVNPMSKDREADFKDFSRARKARISRGLREQVAVAAGHRCGYCRTPKNLVGYPLTIDHIVPEARGGTTVEENLWLACVTCNQYKGTQVSARDAKTRRRVHLFNPRLQNTFPLERRWGRNHRSDFVRTSNGCGAQFEPFGNRGSSFALGAGRLVASC
jgi:5-methylcytosine-specific restriction endonuclease McrA